MQSRKPIGELLVEDGVIDRRDIERAIERQKDTGGRVGQILVSMGRLDEPTLVRYLGQQLNVPHVVLKEREIGAETLNWVSYDQVLKNRLLPVTKTVSAGEDTLYVATPFPENKEAFQDLTRHTGMSIVPLLVGEKDLQEAIVKYYPGVELSELNPLFDDSMPKRSVRRRAAPLRAPSPVTPIEEFPAAKLSPLAPSPVMAIEEFPAASGLSSGLAEEGDSLESLPDVSLLNDDLRLPFGEEMDIDELQMVVSNGVAKAPPPVESMPRETPLPASLGFDAYEREAARAAVARGRRESEFEEITDEDLNFDDFEEDGASPPVLEASPGKHVSGANFGFDADGQDVLMTADTAGGESQESLFEELTDDDLDLDIFTQSPVPAAGQKAARDNEVTDVNIDLSDLEIVNLKDLVKAVSRESSHSDGARGSPEQVAVPTGLILDALVRILIRKGVIGGQEFLEEIKKKT